MRAGRVSAIVSVVALIASVVLCLLASDTTVTQVPLKGSSVTVEQTLVDPALLLSACLCAGIWLVSAVVAIRRRGDRTGRTPVGDNDRVTDPCAT